MYSGLTYLEEYLSHVDLQLSEVWDDAIVFELLWEKRVRGVVLSEPIHDIGAPINWFSALSEYIR